MCSKASDRSARNPAARLHGGDHLLQARDRCPRKRFAVKLNIEPAADSCSNLNRRRVLSRASKKKFAKPVAGARRCLPLPAQQKCAGAVAEEPAELSCHT